MRHLFPEKLCGFRNYFIACYLIASSMIGYYAYKSYCNFFVEKKFMMEVAAYKIAADLVNIFDHAESSLNEINKKIVMSDRSKAAVRDIMLMAGKSYTKNLLKYELSTGKFYWIDDTNRLVANSEVGFVSHPIDLSNRDYLQNTARDPRKIIVGQPLVGAASGQYVIPAAVGAEDGKGRYVGTMAVSFRLSDLSVRYKEISDLYNVNFALLGTNNDIIFESQDGTFGRDRKLLDDLTMHSINAAEEFVAPFSLKNRDNSYMVLRASDKYQYKILTGYQNKDLHSEMVARMFFFLVQFLVISLCFAMAILCLRRQY